MMTLMGLLREILRLALVCLTIVSVATPMRAQQRILWQGAVKPDEINIYTSPSTRDRVATTLKKGDAVNVVLEITVMGDAWCRIEFSGQSEVYGYVLCLNLEQGHFTPKQIAHSEPMTTIAASQGNGSKPDIAAWVDCGTLDGVPLFNSPDYPTHTAIATLKCGERVSVLGKSGSWIQVRTKASREGYISPLFVSATQPLPSTPQTTQKTTDAKLVKPAVLTNNDILDMNKLGLASDVLVAKIKSSECNFDTSPSQLQQLKLGGLSDAVILAMVQAPMGQAKPAASAPPAAGSDKASTNKEPVPPAKTRQPTNAEKKVVEKQAKAHAKDSAKLAKNVKKFEDRVAQAQAEFPGISKEHAELCAEGQLFIGMTADMLQVCWPFHADKINNTYTGSGIHQQVIYDESLFLGKTFYIYLDNGVVTSWQVEQH